MIYDHGIGFQFLVETRVFIFIHMVETKHSGPCSRVVIKMKNEKHLILFLRILNVISGKFRDFFF